MFTALIAYTIVASGALLVELWLLRAVQGVPVTEWLAEHVYVPLLRIVAVLVFIFTAYPDLFDAPAAGTVAELLSSSGGRFNAALNVLMLLTLTFPLIPVVSQLPGLILPLQGIVAACLLFSWHVDYLGIESVRYWMGWTVALKVVITISAGYLLNRLLVEFWHRREHELTLAHEIILMLVELPAVLIYSQALGAQLR